jgi:hypothetical protein
MRGGEMRIGPNPNHKYGDIRIRRRFLWLPVHATYQDEIRWLEYATLKQKYLGGLIPVWATIEFVDDEGR